MFPQLFTIDIPSWFPIFGGSAVTIHTYGVLIASAFLASIGYAIHQAERMGEDPGKILDLCFWILVSAIVGSRILHVIVEWRDYYRSPLRVFAIWEGGLVFYGGALMAIIVGILFIRSRGMNLWRAADIIALSTPIGIFLGRLGCFSAGCCYGLPTNLPWGVKFGPASAADPIGTFLHPTQLYSSLDGLILFFVLAVLNRYRRFHGQIFFTFLLLYSILRSVVEEPFRADPRGAVGFLSTSQFISVLLGMISITMLYRLWKQRRTELAAAV